MTPEAVVTTFIQAVERRDLDAALALLDADVAYDNVPVGPVHGHDGVRSLLGPLLDDCDEVDWVVHRQLSAGEVVVNERTDRFRSGGRWKEIAVAGFFEVREGRIVLWRDYFDLQTFTAQLADGG